MKHTKDTQESLKDIIGILTETFLISSDFCELP